MSTALPVPLRGLHRYTWWSLVAFAAATVLAPIGWSAPDLADMPHALVWTLAAAAFLVAVPHLVLARSALEVPPLPPSRVTTAVVLAAGILALVLPWLVTGTVVAWAIPAAGLLGAVLMHVPERGLTAWAVVGTVVIAADVAAAATRSRDAVVPSGIGALFVTAGVLFSLLGSVWIWRIARRLDEARRTEADLAVAQERLRFAADLHDLQGHHLQVIALKGSLVARLVGTDDATARREAEEVAAIARTALAETRDVVQGYRQAGLATEVGNAVEVLRAAGIDTVVEGEPETAPPAVAALFGALVREGTTNVLRHSRARRAVVSVGDGELAVINDAPRPPRDDGGDGTGIASLRERFGAAGGQVVVHHEDDRFELRGSLR